MESTEKQMKKIICSEDEVIEVDVLTLSKLSPVIRNKLAQESDKNEEDQRIVVNNVTTLALEKIMDYCNVHVHLTSPRSNKKIDNVALWDENFVKLEPGTLCELASAAYHLEVKPLVDLTCQAIAYLLKGKSPAEIRKTFNIPYDFSPEDDAPPPTVRDKLRNKLCFPKKKAAYEAPKKEVNEDQRTVQELLNFINDSNNSKKKKKKKKKTNATPNKSTPNPKSHPNPTKSTNITTPTKTSKGNNNGGNNNKNNNNTTNVNSAKNNNNNINTHNNNSTNNNKNTTQQDNNNNNKNSSNKNVNTQQNTNPPPSNKKAYDPPEHPSSLDLPEELLYDVEEDEEDEELDEELEEFRRRLNNINVTEKISLPSSLSQALVGLSQNNK